MGLCYFNGTNGIKEVNFPEAFKWFQKAADQGDSMGLYYMAMLYNEGYKDKTKANELFQKAMDALASEAEAGDTLRNSPSVLLMNMAKGCHSLMPRQ